jgi:hypothetical protein
MATGSRCPSSSCLTVSPLQETPIVAMPMTESMMSLDNFIVYGLSDGEELRMRN